MVDATVTLVERGHIRTDLNHIVEGAALGHKENPNPETQLVEGPVYNLVVDHPEATILWDTGSHPEAGQGHWPAELYAAFEHYDADEHRLSDDLADVGYSIDDVDCVLQTHLHLDHAGGLYEFEGTDVPVVVHGEELKYAYLSAKSDAGSDAYVAADFDRDLNWRVLSRDRTTLYEDLEVVRLPGHTPGVLGMKLDLDGHGTVIFTGDQAYVRENYHEEEPLGAGLLWSGRDWRESLSLVKELERRHDATVICGHDAGDAETVRNELP